MLLERTTYAVYCQDFHSIKCAGIAGGLAAIEHKCRISDPPLASWEGEIGGGM